MYDRTVEFDAELILAQRRLGCGRIGGRRQGEVVRASSFWLRRNSDSAPWIWLVPALVTMLMWTPI